MVAPLALFGLGALLTGALERNDRRQRKTEQEDLAEGYRKLAR